MITDDPLIGRQLANFRIERVIGRGGMAQVYYGRDVKLQRPVAIKVIDVRYRGNPAYAKRFVREAQAVATWRHENIVQIYYADDEDELYYFVMEYIDGLDLGKWMSRYVAEGRLMPRTDVLRIGRAIASALDYAHRKGVIHRDVKPSNVILAGDSRVVLTDFGLAMDVHQGSLGEVFGTAHYTAPEQARRSADAVPQSDLYSLGVILYEMLTGVVPFDDPSPTSVALQHMTLPPPPPRRFNPDLNEATEAVLLKALSKSPGDRYPTGGELMNALESALRTYQPAPVKRFSLPPPPAGSQLPETRPVSRRSIAERVASHSEASATPPIAAHQPQPPPRQPAWHKADRNVFLAARGRLLMFIAIAVVLGIVLVMNQRGDASQAPALLPTGMAAAITQTATSTPTTIVAPAETIPPSATSADVSTLMSASTLTPIPPTVAELPPATALPTVLYPGGQRFVVYYDDNSLYLLNASGSAGAVSPIAFERLDTLGVPLNRFDGWRWSRYYPRIEFESCLRIEIRSSPAYLRPSQCSSRYNSTVTASRGGDFVFWTAQEGSSQFRVLWNEQEVARCEIAAGICEVFLP